MDRRSQRDRSEVMATAVVLLIVVVLACVSIFDYASRDAELTRLWREAERRGYAERYYTRWDDTTPKWRWREVATP